MNKLFISLIFCASFAINSVPIGPFLAKLTIGDIVGNGSLLPLLVNQLPCCGIYQIRVLEQKPEDKTCARYAMMNLINVMNALSITNRPQIKLNLQRLFNERNFDMFNKEICRVAGLKDDKLGVTKVDVFNKITEDIKNGDLSYNHPHLKHILPADAALNLFNTTPVIVSKDLITVENINRGNYITNQEITHILNDLHNGKELLNWIIILKTMKIEMFGVFFFNPINYPDIENVHCVSIVCSKIDNKKFEFFILDSFNSSGIITNPFLQFLKKLMYAPLDRLLTIWLYLK